ncbi:MAG TPA: TIM barrel protein [Gemmatales bacterium]|nr:TIM barrel protein [Gemmatales bacterium]
MISVTLESLSQPLRLAVITAAKAGCQGMVFDATGVLSPTSLGETARRELRHLFQSHLLKPVGLRCPLRRGLDEWDGLEPRLERLRQAMQLSFDLGARLILLGLGEIPGELNDPKRQRLKTALQELTIFGDRIGCSIALDAGYGPVPHFTSFPHAFDTGVLGISRDPATLLREKISLTDTVFQTKNHISHTYARDMVARRLDRPAFDVPVGHGDIDWITWVSALEACSYAGSYTIRQPAVENALESCSQAVQFLKMLGVR